MSTKGILKEELETTVRIREFYDKYHLIRERAPPRDMLTYYYSRWTGAVLELGAGTLSPEIYDRYIALDISKSAAEHLTRKGCPVVLGDANHLPFRDESFDTVACYDLLEHLVHPPSALKEMIRVACKRVVIGGPNFIEGKLRSESGWKDLIVFSVRWLLKIHHTPRLIPYFGFDVDFKKDRDAVSATNVLEIKSFLENAGMRVEAETLPRTYQGLKQGLLRVPPFKFWGGMMWITAEKTCGDTLFSME